MCLVNDSNAEVEQVQQGDRVGLFVKQTSFYAENGGQAADRGTIYTEVGAI